MANPDKQPTSALTVAQDNRIFLAGLALAVLLALFLRFGYWSDVHDLPLYQDANGDAATHLALADEIRNDGPLAPAGKVYSQAPLYPWFLALTTGAGLSLGAIRWIQFLLGVLGAVLLGLLGRRWGGNRAGAAAAILGASYGPFLFFEGELLSITLAVVLFELGLAAWNTRFHVVSGLALGLSGLAQPNLLLAAGLFLAVAAWRPGSLGLGGRAPVWIALAGLALPPAVTATRNLVETGEPVLISANGGINFFIGNNPQATGMFHLPPSSGLVNRPEGLFQSAKEVAELRAGHELGAREVDRTWWTEGGDFWVGQAGSAVQLMGRKILLSLNQYEVPNHYDYSYFRGRSPTLRFLPTLGLILPLAAVGVLLMGRGRRLGPLLWLGGLVLSVSLFFITARYRLPVAVIAIPLAGVGVVRMWERRRTPASLLPALGVLVAFALVAWFPLVQANTRTLAHMNNLEGAALFRQGDLPGAESAFRRAVQIEPLHAEARNNLGRALAVQGRETEAVEQYSQALRSDPRQAETYFNLEEIYRANGRAKEAEEILDRLVAARGGQVQDVAASIDYRRGLAALAQGDSARAQALLRVALERNPSIGGAWAAVTGLFLAQGDLASAQVSADRAVSLSPRLLSAQLAAGDAFADSHPDKALAAYENAWRLAPRSPVAPYRIGLMYRRRGDIPKAEGHWRSAVEASPYAPALLALGDLYVELDRPRDAAVVYQTIIRQQVPGPDLDEATRRLAALRDRTGERER